MSLTCKISAPLGNFIAFEKCLLIASHSITSLIQLHTNDMDTKRSLIVLCPAVEARSKTLGPNDVSVKLLSA